MWEISLYSYGYMGLAFIYFCFKVSEKETKCYTFVNESIMFRTIEGLFMVSLLFFNLELNILKLYRLIFMT